MTEEEVQKIQTLLAHHERQIQELSEIATEQAKEITALRARLEKTNQKLSDLEFGAGEEQGEKLSVAEQALRDKPPHY